MKLKDEQPYSVLAALQFVLELLKMLRTDEMATHTAAAATTQYDAST